jgi:hypothetical protein
LLPQQQRFLLAPRIDDNDDKDNNNKDDLVWYTNDVILSLSFFVGVCLSGLRLKGEEL